LVGDIIFVIFAGFSMATSDGLSVEVDSSVAEGLSVELDSSVAEGLSVELDSSLGLSL
jgi:hypothetical protein